MIWIYPSKISRKEKRKRTGNIEDSESPDCPSAGSIVCRCQSGNIHTRTYKTRGRTVKWNYSESSGASSGNWMKPWTEWDWPAKDRFHWPTECRSSQCKLPVYRMCNLQLFIVKHIEQNGHLTWIRLRTMIRLTESAPRIRTIAPGKREADRVE